MEVGLHSPPLSATLQTPSFFLINNHFHINANLLFYPLSIPLQSLLPLSFYIYIPYSTFPSPFPNKMDASVLERQHAILLQRLYHQHQKSDEKAPESINSEICFDSYGHNLQSHWQPVNTYHHHSLYYPELKPQLQRSHSSVSNSNKSSMTRPIMSKPDNRQCDSANRKKDNGSWAFKKRKAEFDMEKQEKEEAKRVEAEEIGEKSEITEKCEMETSTNGCSKSSSKVSEAQKTDYIHVRARRGQATDSHSLAERARREKISKKMKCLQDLVPGCNKVSGKAGMLDEIINYVQSLQKQVEFLSMKLASVNPRLDLSMDSLFGKEIPAYIAQLEAANSACFQYNQMQQGNSSDTVLLDQFQMLPQKPGTTSLPVSEAFIPQLQQLSGLGPIGLASSMLDFTS